MTLQHWVADPSTSPYCGGCGWPHYPEPAVGPFDDDMVAAVEKHVRETKMNDSDQQSDILLRLERKLERVYDLAAKWDNATELSIAKAFAAELHNALKGEK